MLLTALVRRFNRRVVSFITNSTAARIGTLTLACLRLAMLDCPTTTVALVNDKTLHNTKGAGVPLLVGNDLGVLGVVVDNVLVCNLFS